jgi:hypothetical protein
MLSFASAAYLADKRLVGTFMADLETLLGAKHHELVEPASRRASAKGVLE